MFFLLESSPITLTGAYPSVEKNPEEGLKHIRGQIHDKLQNSIIYFGLSEIQVKGYFWQCEGPESYLDGTYYPAIVKLHLLVSGNAETIDHLRYHQKMHLNDPMPIHVYGAFPRLVDFWSKNKPMGPKTLDSFLAVGEFFRELHRASKFYSPNEMVGYSSNINLDNQEWDDFCELHLALNGYFRKTKVEGEKNTDKAIKSKKSYGEMTVEDFFSDGPVDFFPGFLGEFLNEDSGEPLTELEKSVVIFNILSKYGCEEVLIDNEWTEVRRLEPDQLVANLSEIETSVLTYFIRFRGVNLAKLFANPFVVIEEKSFLSKKTNKGLSGFAKKLVGNLRDRR